MQHGAYDLRKHPRWNVMQTLRQAQNPVRVNGDGMLNARLVEAAARACPTLRQSRSSPGRSYLRIRNELRES
jgi:hypothetical protein